MVEMDSETEDWNPMKLKSKDKKSSKKHDNNKDKHKETPKEMHRDKESEKVNKKGTIRSKSTTTALNDEEEDTTVVKKKSRNGLAIADRPNNLGNNEQDINDLEKRKMDTDLAERDAFVARLMEKEESRTKKAELASVLKLVVIST